MIALCGSSYTANAQSTQGRLNHIESLKWTDIDSAISYLSAEAATAESENKVGLQGDEIFEMLSWIDSDLSTYTEYFNGIKAKIDQANR